MGASNRRILGGAAAILVVVVLSPGRAALAATLEVGTGKPFARVEEANAKARPGDVILVHPLPGGEPYRKTGVYVRQSNLTFRGVPGADGGRVRISAEGFHPSGRGSTPRAIFQFNPGTDQCLLQGFELFGAHNESHNGAGVRINGANHVTIRNCDIHDNDMGVMSNGDGTPQRGVNQRIEHSTIHHNGDYRHPGYNHNLYLGGTSVTLHGCEVHSSLTGHNVKSRAHHTRVEYCYVHHSANREFDLVDAADTERPESNAVLLGNAIVKDPSCKGNRGVVHFGQDGGRRHDGTIHLVFNTIVTPFISPLVELSSPPAKARLVGNFIHDGGVRQGGQKIAGVRAGAAMENVTGEHNWLSGGFEGVGQTRLSPETSVFQRFQGPVFVAADRHDYRLIAAAADQAKAAFSQKLVQLPAVPGAPAKAEQSPLALQYHHPAGCQQRPREAKPTLGAFGHQP